MQTRPDTRAPEPSPVMAALHAHLPLTLLVDLALGARLRSEDVLAAEREGADRLRARPLPQPR